MSRRAVFFFFFNLGRMEAGCGDFWEVGRLLFLLPPSKALAGSRPWAMMSRESLLQGQLYWPGETRPGPPALTGGAGFFLCKSVPWWLVLLAGYQKLSRCIYFPRIKALASIQVKKESAVGRRTASHQHMAVRSHVLTQSSSWGGKGSPNLLCSGKIRVKGGFCHTVSIQTMPGGR